MARIHSSVVTEEEKGELEEVLPHVSEHEEPTIPEITVQRGFDLLQARPGLTMLDSRRLSRTTVGASSIGTLSLAFDPFDKFKVEDLTSYAMNDQRWTLQRKKIGLKRRTSGAKERNVRNEQAKILTIKFIRTTFKRKECNFYAKDKHRSELLGFEVCRCGLRRYDHHMFQTDPAKEIQKGQHFLNGVFGRKKTPLSPMEFKNELNNYRQSAVADIKEEGEDELDKDNVAADRKNEALPSILQAPGVIMTGKRRSKRDDLFQVKIDPVKMDVPTLAELAPPVLQNAKKWSPEKCLDTYPTNAYGTIEFVNETSGSNKPAKYIRISDETSMKDVISLLTDYWRLMEPSRPHLMISVTGGAKNFRLDGKKKEAFNSGLIRAVKSTQAWLLTGGMHVGATKSVGEAVNEGQFMVKVKRKSFFAEEQEHMVRGIKCLGIAPWGYVKDNHLLLNYDLNDFWRAKYKVEERAVKHENVSLNGDHSHFLLIDNGIRNRYSGADKFKTELQKVIQEQEPVGLGIPVVLLLLDGGISSIVECSMALKNKIPIVIVANTGRAADLIAYAASMTIQTPSGDYVLRKGHKKQLYNRIVATMTELDDDAVEAAMNLIINCCSNAQLITIFDINSNEGMDKYILYALLKGGNQDSESLKIDQVNLSLLWNRPDIAETHIFPSYPKWPSDSLEDLMTTALIEEKVEFVQLFVINGLIMTEYLTVQRLRTLYNEAYSVGTHLGKLLERCCRSSNTCLYDVHLLVEVLVKKHDDPVYTMDTKKRFHENPSINYQTFEDPYRELMLWAILSNRGNLAIYLWKRCNSPLVAAVVATCVYRSLWKSLGAKNTDIREYYIQKKDLFEKLAAEYLEECFKEDVSNAMGMIERRHPKWGNLDCLELAHSANNLALLSTPCCQASVDISWRRGMIKAPTMAVIFAIICPLLVFSPFFRFQKLGDNRGNLNWFQKMFVFYKSPICKFYAHSIAFVLFLLLYAYVVLFDFRPEMSTAEKLVVVWIATFFFEEINELFTQDSSSFAGKCHEYWDSVWNRFDAFAFLISTVALCLRLNRATFKYGRIAYAVNTTIFYIRLFRIYHVNYQLGPKLVIFYRMISEVVVFMALLLIFILGYGIASQSLQHPWRTLNETSLTNILTGVILTPYYQMYGELQLDEIKGENEERCTKIPSWDQPVCENPTEYDWVTNMMLVFYLIIGNIMLLNLLIAIFTYVFDEVQGNSMEIWKFEMYRLIREFDKKPGLVAPFVVLEHIFRATKALWKLYCRKKKENLEDYMKETLKSLEIFEKEAMASYLTKIKEKEEASLESVVSKMAEKIDKISKYIEQEEELKEIEQDIEWTLSKEIEEQKETKRRNSVVPSQPSPAKPFLGLQQRAKQEQRKQDGNTLNVSPFRAPSEDRVTFNVAPEDSTDEQRYLTKEEEEELDDELTEELSESQIEDRLDLLYNNEKVLREGFSSLPFPPLSRPGSGRPLSGRSSFAASRPATGRSVLGSKNVLINLKLQQDQLSSLATRVDVLQDTVEESQQSMEKIMSNLVEKLENSGLVKPRISSIAGNEWKIKESKKKKKSNYKDDLDND